MIDCLLSTYSLPQMVSFLCKVAGCSRSGYYAWRNNKAQRQRREAQDEIEAQPIIELFHQHKKKVGALQLKMMLEQNHGIRMNHKKIRRLMKKFGLVAIIRQAKPYKKMMKATQAHQTCDNLLDREFDQKEPGKVFLTDITYLSYGKGQKAYLSCVKDSTTKEIVTHVLSRSLAMDFVYQTLHQLKEAVGLFHPQAMLHSDQGFHYTHPVFQHKLKEAGLCQSMSRRGNCWDNAPMESFFGHFKDMVDHKACQTFDELQGNVQDYIDRYNQERYQWDLMKMTPVQYRDHLLTA